MKIPAVLLIIIFRALSCSAAFAADDLQIPEQVTIEHWSCRDVAELAEKYGAEKRLPDSVVVEGKPCSKDELAQCLLSVLEKVCEKCGEGPCEDVSGEDLARIAALHDALKVEISKYEGYLQRRETIERILARPEAPPFEYRVGVNGFVRGEGAGNLGFSDYSYTPGHGEGRFLYRIRPYAYWHPTDYLDIHIEGQWYGFTRHGGDTSKFSLYQGYVEAKLPGSGLLALKAGRQEFSYGSAFILGSNTFFDGLSFDAARLRVQPSDRLAIDLLGGSYAYPFNNGSKGNLEGAYLAYSFNEGSAAEAYVIRDAGYVEHHSGENLLAWGLRGTAALGPVSIEFEPVYESGRIFNETTLSDDDISAYGGHVDLTVDIDMIGRHNTIFLSYALGSGDKDAAEGIKFNKEFRNPNNDTSLIGDMGFVGDLSGVDAGDHHASGLHIFTFGWGVDVTEEVNFSATGHYFLADKVKDGISRNVGVEADFTLTYSISDDLSLIIGYDRFFTGGFFKDATGEDDDIHYGYAMLEFDFAKTKLKM